MSFTYSIKDQLELEFLKLKLGNKKLTKYEVMVLSKSTNSQTHPYGSSIERPIRTNQIYQLIIPGVLDNLARLWTDEVP